MNTRTHLLDCAETAARSHGFDAFSYADLARSVGIRKASIHYHFPVKADLALALVERYTDRFFQTLAERIQTDQTAADQLRVYLAAYREALAGGEQLCLCVAMSAGRNSFSEPVLTRLTRFHEDNSAWLKTVFEAGREDRSITGITDPEAEAHAALALVQGAQLIARAAVNITLFDQAVAAFNARLAPGKTQ